MAPAQVAAAHRCALVLRDLISPYLLRRRKADVAQQLPPKTEQVLFCRLTPEQRRLYRAYLSRCGCRLCHGHSSTFSCTH